jgi:hypothetical protein
MASFRPDIHKKLFHTTPLIGCFVTKKMALVTFAIVDVVSGQGLSMFSLRHLADLAILTDNKQG